MGVKTDTCGYINVSVCLEHYLVPILGERAYQIIFSQLNLDANYGMVSIPLRRRSGASVEVG
jgi:hypothetical protein